MKTGIQLITEERERQISEEEWTPEHDDLHVNGELRNAAISYAMVCDDRAGGEDESQFIWPFEHESWKPSEDHVRNLIKSGALIAAEIDRLNRLMSKF